MKITNLSHIAIGVRDMDRSLAFYRDVVGLKVRADQMETLPDREKIRTKTRRAAYLTWSDDRSDGFIVLDQQTPNAAEGKTKAIFDLGIHHFSFWVDDLAAIRARIRAADVDITHDDETSPGIDAWWYGHPENTGTIKSLLVRDPDGNVVQFDQWA